MLPNKDGKVSRTTDETLTALENKLVTLNFREVFTARVLSHPLNASHIFKMSKVASNNSFFRRVECPVNHHERGICVLDLNKSHVTRKFNLADWWAGSNRLLRGILIVVLLDYTIKLLGRQKTELVWNFTHERQTCQMVNSNSTFVSTQ